MAKKIYSNLFSVAVGATLSIFHPSSANAVSFMGLGYLPGGFFTSSANSVSGDGSVVAGISSSEQGLAGEAFRWTAETGLVALGDLPGGDFLSGAFAISQDGLIMAGASSSSASAPFEPPLEAFRWTAETGMIPLGDLDGGVFSSFTNGMSGDGLVIVGDSNSASGREAFLWTAETGMVGLGDFDGGDFNSTAVGASFDGSIIVGSGTNSTGAEAYRWTAETGLVGLGDLPGGEIFSSAAGISSDGSVIVGRSSSTDSSALPVTLFSGTEAFRWTAETGLIGLGDLPGGNFFSAAIAASGDGSVIVGQSESALGQEPFIWDNDNGMRSLIQDFDLDLNGWSNLTATDISEDGLNVIGFGFNPEGNFEAWIAQLDSEDQSVPEPSKILGTILTMGMGALLSKRKRTNV